MRINGNDGMIPGSLKAARKSSTQSINRLSSGKRVNSAKDDAAALAIVAQMGAEVRGISQAARNATDGSSMLQVADGAMGEVGDMLGRMRELSIAAASGTVNASQRQAIDQEFQSLREEIDRVSASTEFNGRALLDGSEGNVELQVGTDADAGSRLSVNIDAVDSSSLGVSGDVLTADAARASIDALDDAIAQLSSSRTDVGVAHNRIESTLSNLSTERINTVAAQSRIEDVDVGAETANLAMAQIREQFGVALQAQANSNAGSALALL